MYLWCVNLRVQVLTAWMGLTSHQLQGILCWNGGLGIHRRCKYSCKSTVRIFLKLETKVLSIAWSSSLSMCHTQSNGYGIRSTTGTPECGCGGGGGKGGRAWQIILKDSPIILFFIPKFSAHYSFKLAHYSSIFSNSTMHRSQQKWTVMTCTFKIPKTTVFLCINAVCKALQSSPFIHTHVGDCHTLRFLP